MDFKEQYIAVHKQMVSEYMDTHPGVSWDRAYDLCADGAYDRMRDNLADRADTLRQQKKDEG